MNTVEIKIDPAALQAQIVQSILDSAIGKSLEKNLKEVADKWKVETYWDNTFQKIIEAEIQNQIRLAVGEKIKPYLKANVNQFITDEVLNKAMSDISTRIHFKDSRY